MFGHAPGHAFGTPGVVSWLPNVLPTSAAMNPIDQQNSQFSQLFTIRVWREPLGHGQTELRGQVRHVLSGEVRYFREWSALIDYVTIKLEADQGEQ